jgi:hypothetical protein
METPSTGRQFSASSPPHQFLGFLSFGRSEEKALFLPLTPTKLHFVNANAFEDLRMK